MAFRHSGVRSTVVLGIVSLLAAGLVSAESASARTKTNYYSASMNPANGLIRYAATSANASSVVFTITNCGAAFSPPSSCANAKGTNIDSVSITLPTGMSAVNSSTLTASGLKLAPGASTTMTVQVLTTAGVTGDAHNVTFCVSDTTLCSYQATNTALALKVPLKFTFTASPVDGMPKTSLCGTKVQLSDAPVGTDPVPLSTAVTLAKATGSLDPSLTFDNTNTPSTSSTTGLATFDAGATTDCPPYPAVGGPYQVVAVGQTPGGAAIPTATSDAFTVYTKLQDCGGNCFDTQTGPGQTRLDATSNASGVLGTSVFDASADTAHFPTIDCGAGVKKIDGRPDVLEVNSNGDKTVTITWSKQVTLKFTDNGTPHWQVCMLAPKTFVTDSGADATPVGVNFVGAIPLCGAAGLPADNPCMVVSRNAAQEIATITLPASWAGDPLFH